MRIVVFVLLSIFKCVMGKFESFIVGSKYAKSIERFPHVAFLLITSHDNQQFNCGASILNQVLLITAAHCVCDDVQTIAVNLGHVNRFKGQQFMVDFLKVHPDWNEAKVLNDLALCKLHDPLSFRKSVKRVIVMRDPPQTKTGIIAGWGAVEEKDYTFSNRLKYAGQKLWTYKMCKAVLKNALPVGTICGGERQAKSEFCSRGDSGSGLLIRNNILIGLVSFKYVAVSRSLVVYTDVAYHYDWIKRTATKLARAC